MIAISINNGSELFRFYTSRKYLKQIQEMIDERDFSHLEDYIIRSSEIIPSAFFNNFENTFGSPLGSFIPFEKGLEDLDKDFENGSEPLQMYHVGFDWVKFKNFPLYSQKDITWIAHRINTIKDLNNVSSEFGVEFDIRDTETDLIVTHDPKTTGPSITDYFNNFNHSFMILNVKSEGLEEELLEKVSENKNENKNKNKNKNFDYFFLDCSFPMINKLSKKGIKNIALRYSEYEGLDVLKKMRGRVDWVWVDCFTDCPLTHQTYLTIRELGYKICLVSPDLQNRAEDIPDYSKFLLENNIFVDAICTKKYNMDKWIHTMEKKVYWPQEQAQEPFWTRDGKGSDKRDLNLWMFDNVEFSGVSESYPNVLFKTGSKLILPIHEKFMSLDKGTIYELQNMTHNYRDSYNSTIKVIEDPVLFFVYNTDNYYHFIYDAVPYLFYYTLLRGLGIHVKLVISPIKYKFVQETLDLFDAEYIIHETGNYYKTIFVGTSMTHGGLSEEPPSQEIFEVYEDLVKRAQNHFGKEQKTFPEKFYISRRTWTNNDLSNIGTNYTTRRRLMNEDQLVESLVPEFEEVFCENLSMIEKINLFSRGSFIIGAIGGGMVNLVFCPKNVKVICIVSPTFLDINGRFMYSMDHTNIEYVFDTFLIDNRKIPVNTRVQIIDTRSEYFGLSGEVVGSVDTNTFKVQLGSETTTGWNSSEEYKIVPFHTEQLKQYDKGLNSPWIVDIERILRLLGILRDILNNFSKSKGTVVKNN